MWKEQLPSWGPEVDVAVSEYVKGMAACVRGYIEWSFSGPRYFGSSVNEVKETRRGEGCLTCLHVSRTCRNFSFPLFGRHTLVGVTQSMLHHFLVGPLQWLQNRFRGGGEGDEILISSYKALDGRGYRASTLLSLTT